MTTTSSALRLFSGVDLQRQTITDPTHFVTRFGTEPTDMDEWGNRLDLVAANDPVPTVTKALSRMERGMDAIDASCPLTSGETAALYKLWLTCRRIYAHRIRSWVQFEQNIGRKLGLLAQLAKRNAELAYAPQSIMLSGFRFSAVYCEQQSMRADKPIRLIERLTGGYEEFNVVATGGTHQDGLQREWRAIIPVLPVLSVELLPPLSRWSVGLSILSALDRATSYTELVEQELRKKKSLQCNAHFVLGQLLRANVGMVIFHGFRNSHLIARFLPLLWDYLAYLRNVGVGVVLWGTKALEGCTGPSFYHAFPSRLVALNPYRIDEPNARKLAAYYWNRLDVPGAMPESFVQMIQQLGGQREWIEIALCGFLERKYLHKMENEAAAKAALEEALADAMAGPLPALIDWHRGTIDEDTLKNWRDWLPAGEVRR